jgi:hypothetical protein
MYGNVGGERIIHAFGEEGERPTRRETRNLFLWGEEALKALGAFT